MSKNKQELLDEARAKGLAVNEEMTNQELQDALNAAPEQQAAPENDSTPQSRLVNQSVDDPVANGTVVSKPEHGNQ